MCEVTTYSAFDLHFVSVFLILFVGQIEFWLENISLFFSVFRRDISGQWRYSKNFSMNLSRFHFT